MTNLEDISHLLVVLFLLENDHSQPSTHALAEIVNVNPVLLGSSVPATRESGYIKSKGYPEFYPTDHYQVMEY